MDAIARNAAGGFAALAVAACLLVAPAGCEPRQGPSVSAGRPRSEDPRSPSPAAPVVRWISTHEAMREIRTNPDLFILCVADREGYDRAHIADSVLFPVMRLGEALDGRDPWPEINRGRVPRKDQPILCYCWWKDCICPSIPTYSQVARRVLLERGFRNLSFLSGGMPGWIEDKLPLEGSREHDAGALVGGPGGTKATGRPTTAEATVPPTVPPFRIGKPDAVLLITGGTNGVLEVCNCTGPMPGSLSRRGTLLRSYRAAFPNSLLIDTGDALWIDSNDLRNEYLLKGYGQIGYDAVALGSHEWAAPPPRLRRLLDSSGVTALASNVACAGLEPRRVIQRRWPGAKLAVLSDTGREVLRILPTTRTEGLSVSPRADLALRVRRLKAQGHLVVLVAHTDEIGLSAAVSDVGADLVIRGHTRRPDPQLRHIRGTPVVKVGGHAYVGVVAMTVREGRIADLEYRLVVVDHSWPPDEKLLGTYGDYARAAMRAALAAERKDGLDYVASTACRQCHPKQYAAWAKGPHAGAYETLVKARRTGDPGCVTCHTTGFGTKKGFYTIEKTPHLAGLHCQTCHRFNTADHRRKDFEPPPADRPVCTSCHTRVTDPRFDYQAKRSKIRCPKQGETR